MEAVSQKKDSNFFDSVSSFMSKLWASVKGLFTTKEANVFPAWVLEESKHPEPKKKAARAAILRQQLAQEKRAKVNAEKAEAKPRSSYNKTVLGAGAALLFAGALIAGFALKPGNALSEITKNLKNK